MIALGWRLTCDHTGCTRTWEKFSPRLKYETPGLPPGGLREDGWVLIYLKQDRTPLSWKYGHVVFCPEHGAPARTWLDESLAWAKARRDHMRATVPSIRERWAAFKDPVSGQPGTLARRIWDAGQAWEKDHPRPKGPW